MTDPSSPNYKPGVGRLVVDRFDFQNHIEGQKFRHNATSIDLSPHITIDGYGSFTTVQDVVAQLAILAIPPVIQDATTSRKGVVKLAGDIAGVATNVVVTGLRSRPVNTTAPVTNDVLTWSGTNWGPAANTNTFTAFGDLAGTNLSQKVVNISGTSDIVNMLCSQMVFDAHVGDAAIGYSVLGTSIGDGYNVFIAAQTTSAFNKNGGSIFLQPGQREGTGSTNKNGGIILSLGDGTKMVEIVEPIQGQRVVGLNSKGLNSTLMPAGTGDGVIFIRKAHTNPSSGFSTFGSILYADATNGKLHVRQTDGSDVTIGERPNPEILGSVVRGNLPGADGQVFNARAVATSTTSTPVNAFGSIGAITLGAFTVQPYTCVYVSVVMVGKKDGSVDSMTVRMSAAISRDAGSAVKMASDGYLIGPPDGDGVSYVEDEKVRGLAIFWTKPTFILSTNDLYIKTGASSITENITWFTTATFYTCPSYTNP